jgi:Tol biopolymer transport system component
MMRRPTSSILLAPFILCAIPPISIGAQQPATDSSLLTVDRIFGSEFAGNWFEGARWLDDSTYTILEPAKAPAAGRDIVSYDAGSGRRSIFVPSTSLIPTGAAKPLAVETYRLSPDGKLILIFTNSKRVWRQNTRGDYWVLDRGTGKLRQLGGSAPASTLMFAKFSPDNKRVAYVSEHNLYVEDLASGRITPLTSDGSRTIINGTFDWVYEEELDLRDGFRWSPDSRKIAYWQLDASGVRDYLLINDTDSTYSYVKPVQYPKAGDKNSAARVGVVSADGGPTQWMAVPEIRATTIARMDWAATPMRSCCNISIDFRTPTTSCWRTHARARRGRFSPSATARGSMSATICAGSTAARRSRGRVSATAGATSIRFPEAAVPLGSSLPVHSTRPSLRSIRLPIRFTTRRRPITRPNRICTAAR